MRKELTIHIVTVVVFLLIITILRRYFTPAFILFWIGGLAGTLLPDVDHVIYVYLLRPHELTSQRAQALIAKKQYFPALDLIYTNRAERRNLIFHNAWFQVLFLIMTYWVLVSSNNLFGRGLMLAFSLHLIVDQFMDLYYTDSLKNWFEGLQIQLTKEKSILFSIAGLLIIAFLGLVF